MAQSNGRRVNSLLRNNTWKDVDADTIDNITMIRSRWVLRTNINLDRSTRFKARLVIKGYQQTKGIDFTENFGPVSKPTTLRVLLAFASRHNWKIDDLNVVAAFINLKNWKMALSIDQTNLGRSHNFH
jgi:hypothetical protein